MTRTSKLVVLCNEQINCEIVETLLDENDFSEDVVDIDGFINISCRNFFNFEAIRKTLKYSKVTYNGHEYHLTIGPKIKDSTSLRVVYTFQSSDRSITQEEIDRDLSDQGFIIAYVLKVDVKRNKITVIVQFRTETERDKGLGVMSILGNQVIAERFVKRTGDGISLAPKRINSLTHQNIDVKKIFIIQIPKYLKLDDIKKRIDDLRIVDFETQVQIALRSYKFNDEVLQKGDSE